MPDHLVTIIGDKASPAARGSSEIARICGLLVRSPSLSVGFSIRNGGMDAARPAPQRSHYHVDVIYSQGRKEPQVLLKVPNQHWRGGELREREVVTDLGKSTER